MKEMPTPPIFDRMAAVGDPARARLLLLLERRELTVSELCAVLQTPQSTVSRHLRALSESGWLSSRKEGTSRWYGMTPDDLEPSMRRLWELVREEIGARDAAARDRDRLRDVLRSRRTRSQEFFSSAAGQWDRLRDEMFGPSFFFRAFPALLDPDWVVGDLGCGTGQIADALAPFVRRVIAVDGSDAMLDGARRRLGGLSNVELRQGEIEALPLADASLDAATLVLVLHHLSDPVRALAEVARVIRPGGRLLVADMLPHDREDLARRMGHVWLGFSERAVERHLGDAGFETARVVRLTMDPRAKGPSLFAASARRRAKATNRATTNDQPSQRFMVIKEERR